MNELDNLIEWIEAQPTVDVKALSTIKLYQLMINRNEARIFDLVVSKKGIHMKSLKAYLIEAVTEHDERHRIAQHNAALPIESGGLGLHKDNTSLDRAKAMGFEDNWYHGRYEDYNKIHDGSPFYATKDPSYASIYAVEPTSAALGGKSIKDYDSLRPNVMPVMINNKHILDTRLASGKKVFKNHFHMQYGNGTPLTAKGLPDWVEADDFGEMFADKKMPYKGVYADEGKISTWDGGSKDRGVSAAIFDHSAVRSRFAAFDPKRQHESDLLA